MEILIGIFFLLVYFLPSLVGSEHKQAASIFVLNLFLGWTLVGWVVAFIWACSNDSSNKTIVLRNNSSAEELIKLKTLLDSKLITEQEFKIEKQKILGK